MVYVALDHKLKNYIGLWQYIELEETQGLRTSGSPVPIHLGGSIAVPLQGEHKLLNWVKHRYLGFFYSL